MSTGKPIKHEPLYRWPRLYMDIVLRLCKGLPEHDAVDMDQRWTQRQDQVKSD